MRTAAHGSIAFRCRRSFERHVRPVGVTDRGSGETRQESMGPLAGVIAPQGVRFSTVDDTAPSVAQCKARCSVVTSTAWTAIGKPMRPGDSADAARPARCEVAGEKAGPAIVRALGMGGGRRKARPALVAQGQAFVARCSSNPERGWSSAPQRQQTGKATQGEVSCLLGGQTAHQIAGRSPRHGRAFSNADAMRNTVGSSKVRPTICRPVGMPVAPKPLGTLATGHQDIMLNG